MGLFDFLKKWKKKKEAEAPEGTLDPSQVDPSEINPPPTRFTEEYQEFLAGIEAGVREQVRTSGEESTEEPCEGDGAQEPCESENAQESCEEAETDTVEEAKEEADEE